MTKDEVLQYTRKNNFIVLHKNIDKETMNSVLELCGRGLLREKGIGTYLLTITGYEASDMNSYDDWVKSNYPDFSPEFNRANNEKLPQTVNVNINGEFNGDIIQSNSTVHKGDSTTTGTQSNLPAKGESLIVRISKWVNQNILLTIIAGILVSVIAGIIVILAQQRHWFGIK